MIIKEMNGAILKALLENGYKNLLLSEKKINDLNVFPVPDGDTGTNMKNTLLNGIKNINETESVSVILNELSRGMLLGARGNSGVILSQIFKGISSAVKEQTTIDAKTWANALINGYKTAYASVVKPVEGTILTVAREGIENIIDTVNEETTLDSLLLQYQEALQVSLNDTPKKLQALQEANVVDSGGAGLLAIIEGMVKYIKGEEITGLDIDQKYEGEMIEDEEQEFGFCTEFIVKIKDTSFNLQEFIAYLESIGNSIVAVQDEDLLKVHVHTMIPDEVFEKISVYGSFIDRKKEDMTKQHNEILKTALLAPHKTIAYVAVCQGEGLKEIYNELGCDIILTGGQTMNVPVEDFIEAFTGLNADNIIVLPNNKNIILAAKQAKKMVKKDNIHIIETKSVVEGYFALAFKADDEDSIERQLSMISENVAGAISISTTRAIRDTKINDLELHEGDYISLDNKNILAVDGKSKVNATLKAIELYNEEIENKSVIAIIKGKNATDDEVDDLSYELSERYPSIEVGVLEGNQDVYDFIVGIF